MEYTVIRSGRKTAAIEIKGGRVIVRVPMDIGDEKVRELVEQKQKWIEKHLECCQGREAGAADRLTAEDIDRLADRAMAVIPQRVRYYAPIVGVSYGKITIRNQRTKWGSCSSNGSLNFNCLLMLAPPEVLDSIVVHELCHRKFMNHSDRFYAEVLRVFPDYWKCIQWLKEHGGELMRRMIGV